MNEFLKTWYDAGASEQFESTSIGDKFLHKLDKAFETEDWIKAKTILTTTEIDTIEIEKYVEVSIKTKFVDKKRKVEPINNALVYALLNRFDGDKIFEIQDKLDSEDARAIAEELRLRKNGKTLAFVISNNCKLEGKIIAERGLTKQSIDLARYYEPTVRGEEPFAAYFGDGWPRGKPMKVLSNDFFAYDFESENKQYLLLTENKINATKVKVKGMYVPCSDRVKVGGTFTLPSNVEVVFVTKSEDNKVIYTEEQIKKWFIGANHESLVEQVLGKFRHPKWFEQFTLATLFSGIYRGYPLHFMWVGPAGSGKTYGWLKNLHIAIPDNFVDSKSTFKAYIPSYGGQFNQGWLLTSERICYGDEFLSSLITSSNNLAETGNTFGKLTSVLEWDTSPPASGNGAPVSSICPTMQLLACTNFQSGLQNINECSRKLNNAAMSRMLWYVQTKKHLAYCMEKKDVTTGMTGEELEPVHDPHVINVYDFFKTRFVKLEGEKITRVVKELEELIPNSMSEVYSRYDHHFCCLVDGVAKYRWLIGEKDNLDKADDEDYLLAQKIFQEIVLSWGISLDFDSISKDSKVKSLTLKQHELFKYVCDEHGITTIEIEKKFGGEAGVRLGKLVLQNLIKDVEGGWYPFWHYKFKTEELKQ